MNENKTISIGIYHLMENYIKFLINKGKDI